MNTKPLSNEPRSRSFASRRVVWSVVMVGLAMLSNWPVRFGLPVGFWTTIGFPFQIARWQRGELETFRWHALCLDLLVWGLLIWLVPILLRPKATT
ncbi:hypothetical protein [Bremerella cremea]|uniref:hypothetical protein n=1 Tax=Bremerella cremea TaxID=1031537 RepID=UPI0031ED4D87